MFKMIARAVKMDAYRSTYALRKSKDNIKTDLKGYKLLLDHGSSIIDEYEKSSLSNDDRIRRWREIKALENFESNKKASYSILGMYQLFFLLSSVSIGFDVINKGSIISILLQILFVFFGLAITVNQQYFCICDKKDTLIDRKDFFKSVVPYLFINYIDGLVALFDFVINIIKLSLRIILNPSLIVKVFFQSFKYIRLFLVSFFTFRSEYSKEMQRFKSDMITSDVARKAKRKKRTYDEEESE
jgi:hypothetical protein